jgi:hypothetical protein
MPTITEFGDRKEKQTCYDDFFVSNICNIKPQSKARGFQSEENSTSTSK